MRNCVVAGDGIQHPKRGLHPEIAETVCRQADIYIYVLFFSILTFNNHHVIAIKCIATTAFLFQVDGVMKLGETIH